MLVHILNPITRRNKVRVLTKGNPKPEVSFQPKKCVVIHDFQHHVAKNMELRKLIGKTSQDVVIEKIIRTGNALLNTYFS